MYDVKQVPPSGIPDETEDYRTQSLITDPGEMGHLYQQLPEQVGELVKIVQGLLVHIHLAQHYHLELTSQQKEEVRMRWVRRMLAGVLQKDSRPLGEARPPERRLVGNCRDHTVLLVSLLRAKGIPARARCGFARYLEPGSFMDHWICEYWDEKAQRWIGVDPQIDPMQRELFKLAFDPLEVPSDQFVNGARAWQLCRSGQEDPGKFGILDFHGLWFVLGDYVRDLAALNKMELLPFDFWGIMERADRLTPAELEMLDEVASLVVAAGPEIHQVYNWSEFKVPKQILTYTDQGMIKVDLMATAQNE